MCLVKAVYIYVCSMCGLRNILACSGHLDQSFPPTRMLTIWFTVDRRSGRMLQRASLHSDARVVQALSVEIFEMPQYLFKHIILYV